VYELVFHPDVTKGLQDLDRSVRQRILNKVQWLLRHVEETSHQPLTAQWQGMCRLRVGDYRVIYEVDREHRRIIVYAVGHRREIYRSR